ncbi:MAG: hypothetical protein IK150_01685 [Lachnospiraceae bacterium]|nr:hypothetical protein [Lachnospiraceae bacterium]
MEGKQVTDHIWLCPDGKYRWVYEFSMLKNPVILLTVLKVFGIAAAAVALFAFALDLFDDWQITVPDEDNLKILLIVVSVFIGIIFLSYLILAGIYGWKYEVLFEMDDESVSHIQMPKQYKKAEAIGWITAMAGALSGSLSAAGAGLNATSGNVSVSDFSNVRRLVRWKRMHTIKVQSPFNKNQVYAETDADYEFVWAFLKEHCPNARV